MLKLAKSYNQVEEPEILVGRDLLDLEEDGQVLVAVDVTLETRFLYSIIPASEVEHISLQGGIFLSNSPQHPAHKQYICLRWAIDHYMKL